MSFTQPCFIRKNTPELREKLQDMGYRQNIYDKNEYPWLAANHNMFISVSEGFERLPEFNIDCGTNEELFLALAALREDSDYMQWFVMDVEIYMDINQGDWFIATDRNKGNHIGTQIDPMCCHKATVEEIIEQFK